MAYDAQIHILDGQNDVILDFITAKNIIDDTHKKSLEDTLETYEFITFADRRFSQYLEKRNRIIIPDEDETLREFVIFEAAKYRDTEGYKAQVFSHASYLELKKARILYPTRREGLTASQHAGWALNDTGWTVGIVEAEGTRTFTIEKHTNPYEFLRRIANEFEVELRFRIEHDGQRITGRYVDLLERIGEWRGREIEFGKDLDGIRRIEKQDIVTALLGLGPEREDGTRIEVLVEDEEALQRWGRIDEHGNLHHLIEPYEIQSERTEMTEEEARQYTRTALNKRINTQVTYEATIVDLENVPGMENKKIRFGDTIKIKDTKFNPPLYLEARVFEQTRSIKSKAKKEIKLGDYIEYTEEEVHETWRQFVDEIRKRLERLVLVSIISSAGNVFKNAQGSTQLTAKTFLSGNEVDEDGTKYEYRWHKFDKNGDYVPGFYKEGKTITVNASDIDEKASFRVEIILDDEVLTVHEITLTNVFDGEDGEQGPPGPKGEDGKTFYTWIKYADTPTSGMSDNPEGKEYIGIAYNKETPTPSTNYADYVWSKFKGEQGVPGPPGEDGQPTYTWVKYADDEHGNGMSDSPDGKLYIGLAFNKTTPEESNNPADYTWSLMPQNIEIGGRNLLREGMFLNLIPSSSGQFTTYSTGRGFYIPVTSGEVYSLSRSAATNDRFRYCFSVEEPASGVEWSNMNTHDSKLKVENIVVPEGVNYLFVYIRYQTGDIPKIKLEKGNKATDWTPAPEDVQAEIDEAKQEAEEAKQEAQNAMSTADGKNTVFRQSSAPPTTNRKIGDLWFKTDEGNKMYVWTGEWTETKLDYQALSVGKLSAISADLGNVTAGNIQGVTMNLADGKFIVDEEGNVTFKGNLDGATGSFSGILESLGLYITSPSGYNAGFDINFQNTHRIRMSAADSEEPQLIWFAQDESGFPVPFIMTFRGKFHAEESVLASLEYEDEHGYYTDYQGNFYAKETQSDGAYWFMRDRQGDFIFQFYSGAKTPNNNIRFHRNVRVYGDLQADNIPPVIHDFLSLINGWQNYGAEYTNAAFTKKQDGFVHLRGMVRDGTIGRTIAQLPIGCRPLKREVFTVLSSGNVATRVDVHPNGEVIPYNGSPTWISLSGISFRAEN